MSRVVSSSFVTILKFSKKKIYLQEKYEKALASNAEMQKRVVMENQCCRQPCNMNLAKLNHKLHSEKYFKQLSFLTFTGLHKKKTILNIPTHISIFIVSLYSKYFYEFFN
ncbi:hypothetical protein V6Z11_A07G132000 [Gossypium hirsutum]